MVSHFTNLISQINRTVQKGKDDDPEQRIPYVTGLVELEMELLVAEEAKKEPVGKKRNKPNHVSTSMK